jgi:hypothetical protein
MSVKRRLEGLNQRGGRIDLFDELRAVVQARAQRLKDEKAMVSLMDDLFDHLCMVVTRVVKNNVENAPDGDSELEIKYYQYLRDFLSKVDKDKKDIKELTLEKCDQKIKKIIKEIKGDSKLQDKIVSIAEAITTTDTFPSNPSADADWLAVLKHGVTDVKKSLRAAQTKLKKLQSNPDKAGTYKKAIEVLKGEVHDDLHAFKMGMLWLIRDTEENAKKSSELSERDNLTKDEGANDMRKHIKKVGKSQKAYITCTNKAIDTLIDVYESVDSENQSNIISPRDKRAFMDIQRINRRNMVKESKAEIAKSTKSYGRKRSNAVTER